MSKLFKFLILMILVLIPIDAASATPTTRNSHPEDPMIHPELYFENHNSVRFDSGGTNYAGAPNQQYVCSFDELMSREGNCSTIPVDPVRGTAVFTTNVAKGVVGNKPTCVAGTGTGLCEYVTEWGAWRFTPGKWGLSKVTMSPERLDWYKATPAQGAAKGMIATNAAPGDMMAHAVVVHDLAGARSAGDEGDMLVRGAFRDFWATAPGWVPNDIHTQIPENRSHVPFSPIIKGNRQQHWNAIGPDRMIIFPELNVIPITIEKDGYNPKPGYMENPPLPQGGAVWKLETPLPRILKSRSLPNGISRTDYCLTMDAAEYDAIGGKENQYLQVASTPDEYTLVTNFVRQGVNRGMPRQYINGYELIDSAVNKGINTGRLVPCSVLRTVEFPDTDSPVSLESIVNFKFNNANIAAIQEGVFEIEPMTEVEIPYLTEYRIPASGMYSLQAYTVVIDQRLGSGGEVSAYMAHTAPFPDSRAAHMGMYIGGSVPQTRKDAGYPYTFKKGIEMRDTETPLTLHNPSITGTDKRPIAVLGALNSTYVNHSQINYIQPTDGASEVVFDAPVGKDNYVVMVRVGDGEPNPKTCTRPGLERYYQLDTNTEWICNSEKEFFVPSRSSTTTSCELTECEKADINGDGAVGGPDFTLFISNFGSVCSAQ